MLLAEKKKTQNTDEARKSDMRERESTRNHKKKCDEILKDLRMGERRGAGRRKLSREREEREANPNHASANFRL